MWTAYPIGPSGWHSLKVQEGADMNVTGVVREVSRRTGLSHETAQHSVDAMLETILAALEKGDEVRLGAFGLFRVAEKAPRVGRQMLRDESGKIVAGEALPIPRRLKVEFRPGIVLRERAERKLSDEGGASDGADLQPAAENA
ncbi:HU family DNA-binding protein [Azospirillum sp. TSO5]|uniref:HU family DNA-binding protein n=1 Tax=Azospirillum sp. TSO5 TaxID=716760 RepID=UPI0011B233D1|nr:HU family DNA-binding protein [Azospirillum sp. TSO5]